jgi:hypothetical protein
MQHRKTKEFFILKSYSVVQIACESTIPNSVDTTCNGKKEFEEKNQKLEELIVYGKLRWRSQITL